MNIFDNVVAVDFVHVVEKFEENSILVLLLVFVHSAQSTPYSSSVPFGDAINNPFPESVNADLAHFLPFFGNLPPLFVSYTCLLIRSEVLFLGSLVLLEHFTRFRGGF